MVKIGVPTDPQEVFLGIKPCNYKEKRVTKYVTIYRTKTGTLSINIFEYSTKCGNLTTNNQSIDICQRNIESQDIETTKFRISKRSGVFTNNGGHNRVTRPAQPNLIFQEANKTNTPDTWDVKKPRLIDVLSLVG